MVRQLLHSTTAYAKFTLAMRNFRRLKAFAGIKNEIWCMDIANVDKQTKYTIGVFSFLVRQDLFDRTLDAKWMEAKDSKPAVRAF